MIAKLTGEVVDVGLTNVVLDVHGVGYLVHVTKTAGITPGDTISLFTHLAVRENALDLYGFRVRDELSMFLNLIRLPKIGPKTAVQILSQADLDTLRKAVATEDATYLSKMSGIGKKSAEKIVSGLRDILGGEDYLDADLGRAENQGDADVVEALLTLGYSERDAREAVKRIPKEISGTNARIKYALKEVSS